MADQTKDLVPSAEYVSPTESKSFQTGDGPHTTNGSTTQLSDFVMKAGGEDRDEPTDANDTTYGHLRARLTTLQDQINIFLTDKMKQDKKDDSEVERRLLDDGVDEDDSD